MRRLIGILLTAALAFGSCGGEHEPLRIGVKAFDEQYVLAEATAQLLKASGLPVEPIIPCEDTYGCQRALREGRIDLMVEYTGTGLVYLGEPLPPRDQTMSRLAELYGPDGLEWVAPLGFDNSYVVVVRTDRAAALGINTISDLSRIDGGLSVACPGEFLRRPLDGLRALLSRYGLSRRLEPQVLKSPAQRVAALLDGEVDVAVVYATDGVLLDSRLTPLADDLQFFPPYEGVFLVRSDVLKRVSGLAPALRRLEGRLDPDSMRGLNRMTQQLERTPEAAAREYLESQGLLEPAGGRRQQPLLLAVHADDDLDAFKLRALAAIRRAYPKRPVEVRLSRDPEGDVHRGKARLALLGSERFFVRGKGSPPPRDERIEAVAVVGMRSLHLVSRKGEETCSGEKRIGLQPESSGSGQVVRALVGDSVTAVAADVMTGLLARLEKGDLDCLLVMAEQGDPKLAMAIRDQGFVVTPLPAGIAMERNPALPFLRDNRIPPGSYVGLEQPVESVTAQVLLAGPSHRPDRADTAGGPATALPATGQPLSEARVKALVEATGFPEGPDPILPSAWKAGVRSDAGGNRVANTVLNLLVIAFLGWTVYLVLRRETRRQG